MKTTLLLIFLFLVGTINAQEQFINFLKRAELPSCFDGLNDEQIDRLVTEREIQADWTTFRLDYDRQKEVLYLHTSNHCDDIQKIHLKRIVHKEREYVFMYKERVPHSNTYGRLRVFQKDEDEWHRGRVVEVTWEQLFQLNERDLKRLKNADQFPKYMLRFEERNIIFDIPWKLYTFGEGSEIDGFAKSNAKSAAKFPYHYFLLSN